jgi:uncharacterized protein
MERKRNFDIHFVGLKNTEHIFEYELNDGFFQLYEESLVQKGDLKVKMFFDKKDSFFILNFQVDGFIQLACDRCTEFFDYELLCDFKIIVKFDQVEENQSNDDDVIYISRDDSSLNVADVIYEYIIINIPIQVKHPIDREGNSACNPEILEKLNLNQTEDDEVDPRWDNLFKLKN